MSLCCGRGVPETHAAFMRESRTRGKVRQRQVQFARLALESADEMYCNQAGISRPSSPGSSVTLSTMWVGWIGQLAGRVFPASLIQTVAPMPASAAP